MKLRTVLDPRRRPLRNYGFATLCEVEIGAVVEGLLSAFLRTRKRKSKLLFLVFKFDVIMK